MTIRIATTKRHRSGGRSLTRWTTAALLVMTFVLAPSQIAAAEETPSPDEAATPAAADPTPAPPDAAPDAAPEADPAPADPAPADPAPADPAPADPTSSPAEEVPAPSAAREPAPAAAAAPAAPVALAAFDPSAHSITITPATVAPGEDFTVTVTGCPFVTSPEGHLQIPVLNPVSRPDYSNMGSGDDELGGLFSGTGPGPTAGDPWSLTYTVAGTAPLGVYSISNGCQTRETVDDPWTFPSRRATLTVRDVAPVAPTVSISPAEGYAGDQFTASIANCPDGNGPSGLSISQGEGHTGPSNFWTAFDYVSASHTGDPKPYVWEVTDEALPGEYSLVFYCYVEAGEPAIPLEPVTYTVLVETPPFDGESSIDPPSGYAGEEFTITGTGCADGYFDRGRIDAPEDLEKGWLIHVAGDEESGDDPVSLTYTFSDEAPPGVYTFHPQCFFGEDGHPYDPVVFTLLERDTDPGTDPSTDPDSETETPVEDPAVSDDAVETTEDGLLPSTGASASIESVWAALLAVLLGILTLAVNRRRT